MKSVPVATQTITDRDVDYVRGYRDSLLAEAAKARKGQSETKDDPGISTQYQIKAIKFEEQAKGMKIALQLLNFPI